MDDHAAIGREFSVFSTQYAFYICPSMNELVLHIVSPPLSTFHVKSNHGEIVVIIKVSVAVLADVIFLDMVSVRLFRSPDLATTIANEAIFRIGTMLCQFTPIFAIKITRFVVTKPVLRRVG